MSTSKKRKREERENEREMKIYISYCYKPSHTQSILHSHSFCKIEKEILLKLSASPLDDISSLRAD